MLTTRYHLDEAHLSHYDEKLKSWASSQPVKTLPSSLYPWTLSEKAGAVGIWPVGGTELKPTVDFLFTETPPASGDKGPENPSIISGVSEVKVTRCGKNLAEMNRVYALPGRGIAVSVNADGSVHVEGASNNSAPLIDFGSHDDSANKQLPYWMEVGKTYTLSFNSSNANGNPRALLYLSSSLTSWGAEHAVYPGESYTFLVDDAKKRALIRIRLDINSTINCDCYIQIEKSSSATSFDGTIPDVYTIPLGSTCYGGTLDVATGVMTVTHSAVTPDASTVDISSAPAALPLDYADTFGRTITSADGTSLSVGSAGGTVVYKLASSQTVQLDPVSILALSQTDKYTTRLNTIYSDAQSVQVGYVKSPIREEFELQQAIVAQGGEI